jgi:hypothetical protein
MSISEDMARAAEWAEAYDGPITGETHTAADASRRARQILRAA